MPEVGSARRLVKRRDLSRRGRRTSLNPRRGERAEAKRRTRRSAPAGEGWTSTEARRQRGRPPQRGRAASPALAAFPTPWCVRSGAGEGSPFERREAEQTPAPAHFPWARSKAPSSASRRRLALCAGGSCSPGDGAGAAPRLPLRRLLRVSGGCERPCPSACAPRSAYVLPCPSLAPRLPTPPPAAAASNSQQQLRASSAPAPMARRRRAGQRGEAGLPPSLQPSPSLLPPLPCQTICHSSPLAPAHQPGSPPPFGKITGNPNVGGGRGLRASGGGTRGRKQKAVPSLRKSARIKAPHGGVFFFGGGIKFRRFSAPPPHTYLATPVLLRRARR